MPPSPASVKFAGAVSLAYGLLLATYSFWLTLALRLEAMVNGDVRWAANALNIHGQLSIVAVFLLSYVLATSLLFVISGWRLINLDASGVVVGRWALYGAGALYLLLVNPLLALAPLWGILLQMVLSTTVYRIIILGIVGAELLYLIDAAMFHAACHFLRHPTPNAAPAPARDATQ